jgi:hypothetical protein
MSFDYSKLRGRIIEKYGTLRDFAEALDVSQKTVTFKMKGYSGFSQADIVRWCDLLDIPVTEASLYFLKQS